MISLAIFSAAVVMVVVVVNTAKVIRDLNYENRAFRIASFKLEELRKAGYAALPADGPLDDAELADLPQGFASTSVVVWNDSTKKVSAGVSWLGAGSTTRYASLTTLITNVGGL